MEKRKYFDIIYDPDIGNHLKYIEKKHYSYIRKTIKINLKYEPIKEAINRKPLLRPSILESAWELRCGPNNIFRIFYKTDLQLREVYILAIGIKERNRLFIGGKEIIL